MSFRSKRKQLSADDEIRILHEAYQFLLKRYNLGESPRTSTATEAAAEKEKPALVSPFMKLSIDQPEPPKIIEVVEDAVEDSTNDAALDDDEVFNDTQMSKLEVDMIQDTTQSDDEGYKRSLAATPKLKRKKRSRSFRHTVDKMKR